MAKGLLLLFIFIITIFIAVMGSAVSDREVKNVRQHIDVTSINKQDFDWQTVLGKMPQYKKQELVKETLNNSDVKLLSLTDAKLVAIVTNNKKTAMFVTSEQLDKYQDSVPFKLSIGEGWLENWTITNINKDRVLWRNNDSGETRTQFLFD